MFVRTLPELYVPGWEFEENDDEHFLDSLVDVLGPDEKQEQSEQEHSGNFCSMQEDFDGLGLGFGFEDETEQAKPPPYRSDNTYSYVNPKYGHTTDFDFEQDHSENFMKRDLTQVQGVATTLPKKVRLAHGSASVSANDPMFAQFYAKAGTKKFTTEDRHGNDVFLCPFPGCSSKYKTLPILQSHMDNHARGGTRSFECNECFSVFYSSGCLKSHKITHVRKTAEFFCEVETCGKRYSTAEGLRLHTRNHHQINKNWKCMAEGCDRSFVRQADLRMHLIRMHCDERPYPCEHKGCRKAFACHSELRRHMEIAHKVKIKGGQKSRPPTKAIQHLLHKAHVFFKEKRKKLRERNSRGRSKSYKKHSSSSSAP